MGISGDFYIAGAGLARGYLNRPELTAEKFLHMSYRSYFYKTGDRARWLPDGSIEFLGRKDDQVKIRGYRIELKEIENRLLNYTAIKEVLVTTREDKPGDKYLCAYIVPRKEETDPSVIDGLALRKHLEKELPAYMIPNYFVELEEIPLTRHHKIDYQRLPEPGPAVVPGQTHEPRGPVEESLVRTWAEVLGTERETISWDANFFQGGGNSLNVITLISKIYKELKVKVPLREFFNTPTLQGISNYIKGAVPGIFAAVQPVEKKEYYDLSPGQVRMYAIQQLDKKSTAYNMSSVVTLEGDVEIEKLENTFKKLIARHESFRTCFEIVHEQPVQRVLEEVQFEIEYYRSLVNDEEQSPGNCQGRGEVSSPIDIETITREFIRPFDLSQAPLLRVGLIKEEDKKHILVVNIHHIIGDALSQGILVRDLVSIYREGDPLPPLKLRYIDYSKWLTDKMVTGRLKKQEDYWLQVFTGEIPVLNLPFDYPEQEIQNFAGDSVKFEAGEEEARSIRQCALEEGVTLQILLLSIFYILLSKLGGQEDIIVATPAAGRTHPDLDGITGLFINTLALRNFPSSQKNFREFLKEVEENSLEAYENQDYPFDRLVEKISHKVNVMFELRKREIHLQEQMDGNPGLKIIPREIDIETTIMDIDWIGIDMDNRLFFRAGYRTGLFKRERIERMTKRYREILKQVLANPGIKLTDIAVSHDYAAAQSAVSRIDHGEFEF
jgi:fengycin family lipopeptide synthetase D